MLNDLTKEQKLIILGLVLLIVTGLGVMAYRHFAPSGSGEIVIEGAKAEDPVRKEETEAILVHVAGQVRQEGVYKIKLGDRVIDAVKLAGGATVFADLSSLNLAEKLKDGQKIMIPLKRVVLERVSGEQPVRGRGSAVAGKEIISINYANENELCKVQGIGPAMAKRIIEYRTTNGPFSKTEDIMKVKGIGKGKFEKIKEQVTI